MIMRHCLDNGRRSAGEQLEGAKLGMLVALAAAAGPSGKVTDGIPMLVEVQDIDPHRTPRGSWSCAQSVVFDSI